MTTAHSRREYLKYAGTGLGAVALLPGVASAYHGTTQDQTTQSPDPNVLDYDQTRWGDIDFAYDTLTFTTDRRDFDLRDVGIDFEVRDRRTMDLTVDNGATVLDIHVNDNGRDVDLDITSGGEYIQFDAHRGDIQFTTGALDSSLDDDDGDLRYSARNLDLEWDERDGELTVTGDVHLKVDLFRRGMNVEFDDGEISLDYDRDLQYRGREVALDWEYRRRDGFEARLL